MYKKSLICLAVLACAAATAGADQFGSYYLGGNLGSNFSRNDAKVSDGSTIVEHTTTDTTYVANLLAGYGMSVNQNYYLGGEFNVGYGLGRLGANDPDHHRVKLGWTLGLHAKLGRVVGDQAMVYLLAGTSASQFKMTKAKGIGSYYFADKTVTKWGVDVGAGVTFRVKKNWNADLRYVHQYYQQEKMTAGSNTLDRRPKNNLVLLGLTYHFS